MTKGVLLTLNTADERPSQIVVPLATLCSGIIALGARSLVAGMHAHYSVAHRSAVRGRPPWELASCSAAIACTNGTGFDYFPDLFCECSGTFPQRKPMASRATQHRAVAELTTSQGKR